MALESQPLSIANVIDGKSPFTHYGWAWNSAGTDRFTLEYPNANILPYSKFNNTEGWTFTEGFTTSNNEATFKKTAVTTSRSFFTATPTSSVKFELAKSYSLELEIFIGDDVQNLSGSSVFMRTYIASNGSANDFGSLDITNLPKGQWSTVKIEGKTPNGGSDVARGMQISVALGNNTTGTFKVRKPKLEQSDYCTIYTPSPSEDATNAYPLYQGIYTDESVVSSTDPSKYTWQRILGQNGTNGEDGKNGVSVIGVEIGYAQSTSGTVTPTTGWQTTPIQPIAGQFIWTRTRNILSDGTFTNYVYVATFNGRDAVVISESAPTNPVVGTLWQKPSDPTSTVLKWNGSAWENWGISVDNIVADNIIAENGVFEKITGVEVEGGIIRNPYSQSNQDTSVANGTLLLQDGVLSNRGTIDYNGVPNQYYDMTLGNSFLSLTRYSGTTPNANNLLGSAALTFNTLQLNDRQNGFSGTLTAKALTPTSWTNLTYASGWKTMESNPCQYKIIYQLDGTRLIKFRGQCSNTAESIPTGANYPFGQGQLPAAIRPDRTEFGYGATNTATGGRLAATNAGSFIFHPQAAGAQYVSISGMQYIIE